ncbi:hypothetical protein O9K51_02760 [Purpureocillium lavendulum]|uniref:Uncharacterized protein n=1 Tax=Purpureocillium lavendulum TaxID=1247861 RepID=A0AB34G0G8_9HYPO|nr:hypothetical protein O9K51_02760 [Purpureocillium lavendulum]
MPPITTGRRARLPVAYVNGWLHTPGYEQQVAAPPCWRRPDSWILAAGEEVERGTVDQDDDALGD